MSTFKDLLNQAGSLNSKIGGGVPKDLSTQKSAASENDLRSIFRASDEIWQRKQLRSDLQWKPRNSMAGTPTKSTFTSTSDHKNPVDAGAPLDQSTSRAFEEYTKRSADRAKVEAERAFINQHILEQSYQGSLSSNKQKHEVSNVSGLNNNGMSPSKLPNGIIDNDQDNSAMDLLANHVSKLLAKSSTVTIESAVRDFLKESGGVEANKLWRKVFALCEIRHSTERSSVADFRNSDQWKQYVIEEATNLLQQTFKNHMETVIENNLQIAKRGGVPNTASLVEAYLNVRLNNQFQYQDGEYGKHPIWPVLFLCLRVGDFVTAAKVAGNLQNLTTCSILVKILSDFNSNILLDGDKRFRLNAEWKHVSSSCHDPFKRAVYGMILGEDCPDVNDSIENWLWCRLMNCKLDPVNGIGHFYKLQTTICVDYGEEYFLGGKGNYTIYFTVLWLTGQFERAIDLLFRSNQIIHAVHIAILAYQQQLLNISTYSSAPILSYDSKDPIFCHFNFSRLVLLYVKNFEISNLEHTLAYCYFLHNIEFEHDAGLEGGNVFEACISRLCFISDKVDLILGRMSESGDRIPGLVDKFASKIDVRKVIARVAKDFDVSGDSLTACRLYILSGRPNEALQICSKQLATYLTIRNRSGESNEVNDALSLANWIETRYQQRPEPGLQESYLAELSTLIKLNVFYSAVHSEPTEALSIIKSLNLLPLTNDELPRRVTNYSSLPDRVKSVLPDIIMALMETLFNLYKDPNTPQSKRHHYQGCSNVLLLYVAQVGVRFPVHINSKFLKLQSQLN